MTARIPVPPGRPRGAREDTPGDARPSQAHPLPSAVAGLRLPPVLLRLGMSQLGRHVLNPRLPWQAQRRRLELVLRASPLPPGTTIREQMVNGVAAEVVMAVPAGAGPAGGQPAGAVPGRAGPAVVHFHGGGYCVGSPRMARVWAAHLSARLGGRVVLPRYRLAPEHPYPAALGDARAAVSAILAETGRGSVVLSGDSAGAGLALAVVLALREAGEPLPAGCILMSPWLDLSRDRGASPALVRRDVVLSPNWLDSCARAYARPQDWADPLVSPLRAGHAGLPPLLIQSASDDLLSPDATDLAASASAAGVPVTFTTWPRMWHDFALQPGLLSAATDAVSQAAWFVASVSGWHRGHRR
jgi:monoterpene epsilon-lactone hydrolase